MNNPSVCHPSGSQTPRVRYLRLRANPQNPEHNSRNQKEDKKKKKRATKTRLLSTRPSGHLTQTARVTRVFFAPLESVGTLESLRSIRGNIEPHHLPTSSEGRKKKTQIIKQSNFASVFSYLGSSGGWLVSAAYIDFLLSCLSRFMSLQENSGPGGITVRLCVCPEWLPENEWRGGGIALGHSGTLTC